MAENLGGISEDVSALIKAINAALPQSNTKKTVDIKVNGTKELKEAADSVKTFGAAVKTLDEPGVDRVTKSVGSIMGLLSGKLKNAPVSSITTSLIEVFTKPDASAKQLLDTVLQVQSQLENVQRLSKKIDVSLLTSSQLDSLLSRQSKIDELQYEFSSNKGSEGRKDPRKYVLRREAYQKYEDIDVYQMARNRKNVGTAKEIATRIGINPDDVTSADAEQLQTYIRTLDLLKQLTDARKEYGEIHSSADANNYLKQEQQMSKVYQEVLKQESAIRDKFKVKGDPLSAAFKLDEQTVKQNAQQAAEAYVNWFMRTLQTQLNAALSDLDTRVAQLQGNIEKRTEQSAQRVEKNTKFARGRGNGGAGGGSGSGTGGTGEGTGDGTGGTGSGGGEIGSGVQRAGQAVKQLSEELRKYIVSEDEAIDKIHDLLDAVIELDEEMKKEDIDSDEYDAKFSEQEEKYKEMLRYRADLIRQGYDSEKYDEEFGIGAWAELDKNTKDIIGGKLRREINDISTYVDSNPITVKVDTKEADEKTQAVKDKVIDLSKDIGERTKIRIFDGVSEEVFDVEKDLDALIAKLDQMALKMEKPVFHAGDLEKDSLSSDSYRPADSLQFVVERHRGDSMGTGTYFASNLGDIIEALHTKSSEGKSGGIYAADLGKYGSSLLQFSGDEEQEAFGEFLRKVTAFVMSIASEDEAFKKQLGSIKVGDTQALFNELKTWFDMFHVNIEDLQAFIDEQVAYVKGFSSTSEMSQSKSIGTNFQQKFIKNKGIDITRGVLNDSYALGNLIFDIDKEHPFDIAFGNNEDIAAYFYKKVFERILSRKAANPLNYVDDIVDQYIGNSGIPSIEEMGTELTPKLQVIGKAHANDKPESISTLNASLLQRDSTVGIDTSEAQKQIEALKQQVSELQQQLQELSTVDKPVVDVDELQAKLERAQEEIDELNHALAGTVSESSNNFLSEQLSEAEQRIHELSEEIASLKQQLTDTQQKAQQAPLDMGALDKKVAELQYLHDKVRTIFDGKDGIINEDMTYDEKFNSAEVQRMIELLSQLTDAELKAAGVMPDDEGSYDSFRQQLQERITLIKEAQDEIQKVIDGQSNEDRNELDLNIARQLEEIYGMAEEVGAKFESRLTPAVREFLSLIEGHVGADEMSNFLGQQNIDRYVDDIISGTKTAKEAFADLENSFGWDTERFESLIDGEVPEELKGLYDQLFSDVENRIKTAEQAADEFNAKLKEIQSQTLKNPILSEDIVKKYISANRELAWQRNGGESGRFFDGELEEVRAYIKECEQLYPLLLKYKEKLMMSYPYSDEYNDAIRDVVDQSKRLYSDDVGLTENELLQKLQQENELINEQNGLFKERLVYLKEGVVIASSLGEITSVNRPPLYERDGADKMLHVHPGEVPGSGMFSGQDILSFVDDFKKGVTQIDLLWRDQLVSFDFSGLSQDIVEHFAKIYLALGDAIKIQLSQGVSDGDFKVPMELRDIASDFTNDFAIKWLQQHGGNAQVFNIDSFGGRNIADITKLSNQDYSTLYRTILMIFDMVDNLPIEEQVKNIRELCGWMIKDNNNVSKLLTSATDTKPSSESPISSDTSTLPEQERAAGEAAAAVTENMKNQSAAVREAEENYNRLNNAVQQYIENQNKVNTGNYKIVHTNNPKNRGRISDMVNYTDIRKGRTTKASIKKILDEYITNKKELDTGYLRGLTDEESFKLSDDDLRFRASNADRILDKLSAYVYSYQNMEEAAKLFGKANSEVFDEVQRRIENAKIANEAFEASFTKSDNVRYALSKYGIDKMTARQLDQLESAMETGGFEAFAAKVKELFGVEIPSSIEEAREAINNLNAENQSLDPSQDGETSSQKREQENETEVQSVEQLIAEYERLGSVLNSIESKYNAGQLPLGEARDTWNEVNENRKAIAEKLTQSGMYYSPDQEKWVQDIINLEDKYKELSAFIESGDTKAIAEMFKIDESSLGNLEILKNNLKLVIDTLNAADGMSASGAKLSWWDGWLSGGSDLIDTDQLAGALKTLGISDDVIEQVAQAHRDAADAAKQHAAEEQAAADATKNVVDAAGAQKVPGKEQPSINPENTGEAADMSALGEAVNAVTKAVDEKTMAFAREAQTVQESAQIELASLQQLVQQLEAIRNLSQNLPKIQLTGKDGTKANPIISPELIKSIEQLKTVVGDFDPAKLTALFSSIKNLKINENVSTRMTELATGFTDLRNALDGWEGNAAKTLEMITQLVQKANALKDVIKTANEQNVKQPKVDIQKAQNKEPEKPVEKSQDEIRADQLKAYNAALKEYDQLERERVRNSQQVNDLGAETLNKRIQLIKQMDDIQKQWNDSAAQGVAKTKEMLDAEQQRAIIEERTKVSESNKWNDQIKRNIGFSNLQNRVSKLKEEKDLRPDIFGKRYEEIEDKAKELSKMFPLKPFDEKAAEDARNVAEELGKMIAETRSAPEYKQAKDTFVSGLNRKIETWATNNQRAIKADPSGFEKIRQSLKEIDTLADGQNVSKMFDEFVAGANRAGNAGETFTQGLMKRFQSLGQYLLSFASFYRVIGVIKQAFNTVKQLDDALTEMRKVSDESLSSLQRYQSLSFNIADEVGTTAQQIQQSTADWLRLGESFEEAQKSAKESTILLNVSEFDNIDKATEALVSASQAYKDLDKIDIIDKLNNIGNNFSISTDQLATGLQNAAAVLMTQGNDIDEALALLTAGNAITQDISKTSAGITYARTYSNIRVLKTRKQLYRSKTRDGSDRAKTLRIIYKYMDKYYNVSSVRMMRFLYSLGFDKESYINRNGKENWRFKWSSELQESLDFFFYMRNKLKEELVICQ